MTSITQHISPEKAAGLRSRIQELDPAYWRDRSWHKPNLGVDSSIGRYYSCGQISCPTPLSELIDSVAPVYPDRELEEWIINWTPKGGYLPPHIDNEGFFRIGVLCLQDDSGAFIGFQDNDLNRPVRIDDKAGQLIRIDDVSQVHEVAPASMDRYVIIFLYR